MINDTVIANTINRYRMEHNVPNTFTSVYSGISETLISLANEQGGLDNISVALASYVE